MRACYYGAYHGEYARNRIIINGLKKNGVEVLECNSSLPFLKRTLKLLKKAISLDFDIIIVGYPGHLDVFSAKLISILKRKPLVFDAFISTYNTIVEEWGLVKKTSLKAKYYYYLDKLSCKIADKVLLDTEQHISYFCKRFNLPRNKFRQIPIGADESIFCPKETLESEKFLVLYYGRTNPLHGLEYIIKAAKIVEEQDIEFLLIGSNRPFRELRDAYKETSRNIIFKDEVPFEDVPEYIAKAYIGLGVFGGTDKAMMVVPNKAYEILAMKKPLVTGDSPAASSVLTNNEHAILCKMADPEAIAESILLLKSDEKLRKRIAENGYKLFRERFASKVIGGEVKGLLEELKINDI
jgi:glycosyltransferase involved in cell wall biosynthesis